MPRHCLIVPTLAVLLGCSAGSQSLPGGSGVHSSAQPVEQCSIFGAMACRAVTLLSGEGLAASSCSAYRASDGTRVETCGSETKARTAGLETPAGKTHSVRLSWLDNSHNEDEFIVERCDQVSLSGEGRSKAGACVGEWKRVGTVAANITSYVDQTALLNRTYLYRVKAANNLGSSHYTAEVSITTPSQ
jgi:hypothetical protein